jgi:hypothetical protein
MLTVAGSFHPVQPAFTLAPTCPHSAHVLRWRPFVCCGEPRLHLGKYCASCATWLKWEPQIPAVLATAPPKPQ